VSGEISTSDERLGLCAERGRDASRYVSARSVLFRRAGITIYS
jgi:hypothetical protein